MDMDYMCNSSRRFRHEVPLKLEQSALFSNLSTVSLIPYSTYQHEIFTGLLFCGFAIFFEVGVRAEGRGSNPMFRKFWNFSGKMLVIRATADGVVKTTLIPKHQVKWAMPNQGVWCQSSVNRWWKLVDYIHSFFPAVSILSWNLLWELHLSVETVIRLNPRLLNPISHFPVPVCQEENPHPDQRTYKR